MSTRERIASVLTLIGLSASSAVAQTPKFAFPPPAPDVRVTADLQYGRADTTRLAMDVYQRPRVGGELRPVLIFFNRAAGAERKDRYWTAWART